MSFLNKSSKIDAEQLNKISKMNNRLDELGLVINSFSCTLEADKELIVDEREQIAIECILHEKDIPEDIEKWLIKTKRDRIKTQDYKRHQVQESDSKDLESLFRW